MNSCVGIYVKYVERIKPMILKVRDQQYFFPMLDDKVEIPIYTVSNYICLWFAWNQLCQDILCE